MSPSARWTWLVYMAGDNNLEGAGRDDLTEMRQAGSTADVNVIVQFDTEANRTTRYRVEKKKLKTLQKMPGVNAGDPKVLTDFIRWGMKTFPAEHYLLDVWNHGGGWENLPSDFDYNELRGAQPHRAADLRRLARSLFRTTPKAIRRRPAHERAIAIDCGSHDYLDNQELRKAVTRALPQGRPIDILGCDACLMNMVEVAYEMKDTARYLVGSEETEPGAGWPYAAILKKLVATPAMKPADLARLIVVEYGRWFKSHPEDATQSAVDLGRIATVAHAVDALAAALLAEVAGAEGPLLACRNRAQKFYYPEYVDLGDLATQVIARFAGRADVTTAAHKVVAAIGAPAGAVIENVAVGAGPKRATGLSIYFPRDRAEYAPDYKDLMLSRTGKWRQLLEALLT